MTSLKGSGVRVHGGGDCFGQMGLAHRAANINNAGFHTCLPACLPTQYTHKQDSSFPLFSHSDNFDLTSNVGLLIKLHAWTSDFNSREIKRKKRKEKKSINRHLRCLYNCKEKRIFPDTSIKEGTEERPEEEEKEKQHCAVQVKAC